MITIKTQQEMQLMQKAGLIVYQALAAVREAIRPGVSSLELDRIAEQVIRDNGAEPNFKGYRGYPATICASIDDVVVHGVPSAKMILKEGQIISIDCGAVMNGYHGDSAFTAPVGEVSPEKARLMEVTEKSFWIGADMAREGKRIGDIGSAIQAFCAQHGYDVVRAMCGHGIGTAMHEDPEVPNYGVPGRGIRLRAGMTIAIEPMVVTGDPAIVFEDDGATRTKDGGLCSHYEHSLYITEGGGPPLILTRPESP